MFFALEASLKMPMVHKTLQIYFNSIELAKDSWLKKRNNCVKIA